MREIKFDYIDGPLTIEWIPPEVRVAKIRCHVDPTLMPGPTRYTALIELYPDRKYELTLLSKSSDAMDGPYFSEHRSTMNYMYECFDAKGFWRRAKRGAVKVVANERGALPVTPPNVQERSSTRGNLQGAIKMNEATQEKKVPAGRLLVSLNLNATNSDGTHFSGSNNTYNLSKKQYRQLQQILVDGYQADVMKLSDDMLAAEEAAK